MNDIKSALSEAARRSLDELAALHPFPWRFEKFETGSYIMSQIVSQPIADADDNYHGIIEAETHEGWFNDKAWSLITLILNELMVPPAEHFDPDNQVFTCKYCSRIYSGEMKAFCKDCGRCYVCDKEHNFEPAV